MLGHGSAAVGLWHCAPSPELDLALPEGFCGKIMSISYVGRAGWGSLKHPCLPQSTQGSWGDALVWGTPHQIPQNPLFRCWDNICASQLGLQCAFPCWHRQENPPKFIPSLFLPFLCHRLGALHGTLSLQKRRAGEGKNGIKYVKKCVKKWVNTAEEWGGGSPIPLFCIQNWDGALKTAPVAGNRGTQRCHWSRGTQRCHLNRGTQRCHLFPVFPQVAVPLGLFPPCNKDLSVCTKIILSVKGSPRRG